MGTSNEDEGESHLTPWSVETLAGAVFAIVCIPLVLEFDISATAK